MEHERTKVKWLLGVLGGVLVLAALLRLFVLQPYVISSNSMEPTLKSGDRILVNTLSYRYFAPSRGDVVVFAYPKDLKRTFVKRVVAVEGETVELRGNEVFINGQVVKEPYLHPGDYPSFGPETVPKGKVFVLGDNRQVSEDSREWGLLSKSNLIGKAWFTYFPFNRLKSF